MVSPAPPYEHPLLGGVGIGGHMARNFGLSSKYDYRPSDYRAPRTQAEAGIEHLDWAPDEWEAEPYRFSIGPMGRLYIAVAIIFFACGGLLALVVRT